MSPGYPLTAAVSYSEPTGPAGTWRIPQKIEDRDSGRPSTKKKIVKREETNINIRVDNFPTGDIPP